MHSPYFPHVCYGPQRYGWLYHKVKTAEEQTTDEDLENLILHSTLLPVYHLPHSLPVVGVL